ncbi:MAG: hypothetical protein AAF922_18740, partial [Pseudomonadota bacterium]
MNLGRDLCNEHEVRFAEVFAQQFRLARAGLDPLEGFRRHEAGPWHLDVGYGLPAFDFSFDEGNGKVVLLGIAVEENAKLLASQDAFNDLAKLRDMDKVIERLNACAGRFAFLIVHKEIQRFYLDPIGSLGAVYDPEQRAIASTINFLLDREIEANTIYPMTEEAIVGKGRFAFGHTPDKVVKRLVPNHYLDLSDFRFHRHWPHKDAIFDPNEEDKSKLLKLILSRLENVLGALSKWETGAILPISGGLDSRLLLACAKPYLEDIDLFSHAESFMSRRDTRIATKLADIVGKDQTIIDPKLDPKYQISNAEKLRSCDAASKISMGTASIGADVPKRLYEVLNGYPGGPLILRGNGSDFLKAVLWRRTTKEYTQRLRHETSEGIRMMMLGKKEITQNPVLHVEYANWFRTPPGTSKSRVYDFMFAEQFLSHGLG